MSPISTDDSRNAPPLNPEVVEFRNRRGRSLVLWLYPAIMSGLAIGAIGALALAADQPWLFPSLGPTVFLQAVTPQVPGARMWNTIVGHAIGLCAGFVALFAFDAQSTPAVMSGEILSMQRVAATVLAVSVTVGLQSVLNAQHPPAAATTMLVTLGGLKPNWNTVSIVTVAVLFASAVGLIVRMCHPSTSRKDQCWRHL
ncbi:MAG: HPP family protein [Methylocystis sp.]|uniref:HPP family protein n=1 Tax=Methylocystis sp. TaxID=1911079 RepID=UPI003DA52A00